MSRMAKRSRSRSPISGHTRSQSPKKWRKPDRRGMGDRGDKREDRVRIYVSNLPYDVKWQALKDIFKDKVGNDVTYAQLYEDFDGKPVGAGVVEIRNRETAMKAIEELDRFEIRGRKIIVREEREKDRQRHNRDLGLHRNEGGMSMSVASGNYMGPNMMSGGGAPQGFTADWLNQLGIDVTQITNQVFVANLDYKVTKSKLEEVFRMAGNVIEAELKLDKDGKSRGLGIVRYEHPIEAVQAISLFTNQFLYDRQMHVRLDRWVEPMLQDIPSRLPNGLKSIGIGMGSQGQPLLNIGEIANTLTLSMLLGQTNNQHTPPAINMNNAGNVSMNHPIQNNANLATNLLGNLSNNNLGNLGNLSNLINPAANLGGLGAGAGALGGQLLPQQANSGNMVTQTAQAILSTLGLNALTGLGGLDLAANLGGVGGMAGGVGGSSALGIGVQNSGDIGHSLINQNMSFSAMQNAGYDNRDGGRGSTFDRNSSGDVTAVFIKNLPFNFTANNLYEKFRVYGDIKYADVKTDSSGRSRGSAVVQYYNADSARRAICLAHGSLVDDRQIEVKLDRLA